MTVKTSCDTLNKYVFKSMDDVKDYEDFFLALQKVLLLQDLHYCILLLVSACTYLYRVSHYYVFPCLWSSDYFLAYK